MVGGGERDSAGQQAEREFTRYREEMTCAEAWEMLDFVAECCNCFCEDGLS